MDLVDNITISYGPKVLDEEIKKALGWLLREKHKPRKTPGGKEAVGDTFLEAHKLVIFEFIPKAFS